MLRFRPLAVCLSVALVAPVALAQTGPAPAAQAKPAAAPAAQLLWMGDLDTDHDGRLSAQEVANRPGIAKWFASMDLNHDGFLVSSEVQTAWQQHVVQTYTEQLPMRLQRFDQADTNKDGKLSPDEAKAGTPQMAQYFAALDANKDGFLSRDEAAGVVQLATKAQIVEWRQANRQAFAQLDVDHNGKLTRVEVQAKMPQLMNSFAFLDENHDGSVSATEFTLPLN